MTLSDEICKPVTSPISVQREVLNPRHQWDINDNVLPSVRLITFPFEYINLYIKISYENFFL